ncbi:hypothetical protein JW898_01130 [Candidatus Woesearchaeota archaeon]|nr:hypothetical protein [Candidatus Woesearchaeota archaeon]
MAKKKKAVAKKKAKGKKEEEMEDDFWSDEDLEEDMDAEELEEIDVSKLKFTKIKDLKEGMEDVNVEGTIDFIGDVQGKDYGQEPYAIGFIKDSTGEIKLTFWGDNVAKAKEGKKVRIVKASVTSFREQLQLNPDRRIGIEFV